MFNEGDKIVFKQAPTGEVVNSYSTELTEGVQTEIVRVRFAGYELEFPANLFDKTE